MIKVRGYPAHMISYISTATSKLYNMRYGVVSLAALFVASSAYAEDCVNSQSTSPVADFQPCEDGQPQWEQQDWNSIILESSSGKSKSASTSADGIPWIATDATGVPANFSTSDAGVSVRTSLGTVRDYNARSASPSIEQPRFGDAPTTNFDMPKAVIAPKTPLDVWTNLDVNGYDGSRDQSTRAGLGADYKLSKITTFGVSLERGDARSATVSGVTEDQKASAYMNLQATPLLSLDARTEWQTGNAEFAAASGAAERGAFILAPKINRDFKMDNGTTLSPYLSYQREFDLSSRKDTTVTGFDPAQSAGAGVTYTKPDSYSLSVSADVGNFGSTEEAQSLSSKFQLSVPLNK
jgi:hypothetical protein